MVGHEEAGTGPARKVGDNGRLGSDCRTGDERRPLVSFRHLLCTISTGEVLSCSHGLVTGAALPAGGSARSRSRDVKGADGAPGGDQVGDEMRTAEFGGDIQRQIHGRSGMGLEPPLTIVETLKAEPRSVQGQCRLDCEIKGLLQQGETFKNRVDCGGFALERSGEGDIDFRRPLGLTDLPIEILRLLIGLHRAIQIAGRRSTIPDRPQAGGLISFRMIYVLGTLEHLQSPSEMVGEYRLI